MSHESSSTAPSCCYNNSFKQFLMFCSCLASSVMKKKKKSPQHSQMSLLNGGRVAGGNSAIISWGAEMFFLLGQPSCLRVCSLCSSQHSSPFSISPCGAQLRAGSHRRSSMTRADSHSAPTAQAALQRVWPHCHEQSTWSHLSSTDF